MGTDKTIQRHVYDKSFMVKTGFNPAGKWDQSSIQTVPRQRKALGLWCMVEVQGRSLAAALGNTQRYYRQKSCAIKACITENLCRGYRKTFVHYLTVKLQLKHLTITRSTQNWSGIVINPLWSWLTITKFN
jgi:hypothetical protein